MASDETKSPEEAKAEAEEAAGEASDAAKEAIEASKEAEAAASEAEHAAHGAEEAAAADGAAAKEHADEAEVDAELARKAAEEAENMAAEAKRDAEEAKKAAAAGDAEAAEKAAAAAEAAAMVAKADAADAKDFADKAKQEAQLAMAPALYLAEFETAKDVLHAAEKCRDEGFESWDVHTPFPIHGMDDAMGLGQSKLGLIVFAFGAMGLLGGFAMMYWMNGIDYPIIIGGKPPEAIPSMIPILFECTVLFSGIAAVFGMLGLNKLPRHHHPVFYSDRFAACSDDRFFISVEASDPKFDVEKTRDFLESLSPSHLELVEEEVL